MSGSLGSSDLLLFSLTMALIVVCSVIVVWAVICFFRLCTRVNTIDVTLGQIRDELRRNTVHE